VLPLLFQAGHAHLQVAPVLSWHFQLPDSIDPVFEIAETDDWAAAVTVDQGHILARTSE
jgi:hypothetical protein